MSYYAAEVLLTLQYLHSNNILYRDLKPENIVISMLERGHIKLVDFGFAKQLKSQYGRTNTNCGTPAYIAPEILNEVGHAFPVDWWALGILTYEMIIGFPPFYTGLAQNNKMYDLIKKKPVQFPNWKQHGIGMSKEAEDFISKCL